LTGELPFEGMRGGFPIILKIQEAFGDGVEIRKIIGCEDLALDNGEVDFDLVEPTGMDGRVDEGDGWPLRTDPGDGALSAMGGSIVDDPEDAPCGAIRFLLHDLAQEATEGVNAGRKFAASKDLGAMDVPGGKVGPGAEALILMFDTHGAPRSRRKRWVLTPTWLDAGLLVRAEHEVVGAQGLASPASFVQVEDASGLFGEVRSAWKNPAAISPRSQSILAEPAPDRGLADGGHDAAPKDLALDVRDVKPGERKTRVMRHLAREGLDADDDVGGEKSRGRPWRERSSSPSRPSSANRFLHLLTICLGTSMREAISLFASPCAA